MADERGRRRRTGTVLLPGAESGDEPAPAEAPPRTTVPPGARRGRLSPGAVLNNIYEVRSLITRGGMAEVYKGVSLVTEEDVAIKVILPHLANEPAVEAMFLREARMALRLSHPALAAYRLAAHEPSLNVLYLVTEFIDGIALDELPEKPSQETVVALMRRLADGLRSAHETGIIHRDLSPDNVLLPDGRPERAKIIDFGIGKDLATTNQTVLGSAFAGKLSYATPEQFGDYGREIGPWTDVYGLGLVMLGLACGHDIDMGGNVVEAIDRRRAGVDVSGAPAPLQPLFAAMLQADPKHRLRSMADVLERLDELARQSPAPAPPPAQPPVTPAPVAIDPAPGPADGPAGAAAMAATIWAKLATTPDERSEPIGAAPPVEEAAPAAAEPAPEPAEPPAAARIAADPIVAEPPVEETPPAAAQPAIEPPVADAEAQLLADEPATAPAEPALAPAEPVEEAVPAAALWTDQAALEAAPAPAAVEPAIEPPVADAEAQLRVDAPAAPPAELEPTPAEPIEEAVPAAELWVDQPALEAAPQSATTEPLLEAAASAPWPSEPPPEAASAPASPPPIAGPGEPPPGPEIDAAAPLVEASPVENEPPVAVTPPARSWASETEIGLVPAADIGDSTAPEAATAPVTGPEPAAAAELAPSLPVAPPPAVPPVAPAASLPLVAVAAGAEAAPPDVGQRAAPGLDPARWSRIFPAAAVPTAPAVIAPVAQATPPASGGRGSMALPLIIGGGVVGVVLIAVAAWALMLPHPAPQPTPPPAPVNAIAPAIPAPVVIAPPVAVPVAQSPPPAPLAIPFVRPRHRPTPAATNAVAPVAAPAAATPSERPPPAHTAPVHTPPAANPPPAQTPKKGNVITRFFDRLFGGGHHAPANSTSHSGDN